ncbi:MAG: DUF3343 domain-containing protein [Actinobacteria bacterium]|nr:DUF3343 domain-containing protein [Actinomycetota bacterium]
MRLFQRKGKAVETIEDEALGLFLFDEVTDALAAERALKASGYQVSLVAPPPHLRAGCDLAVALPRVEQLGAQRVLAESSVHVRDWVDGTEESTGICDLVTTVDFGRWLMVRAGNMKIVVDKDSREIVNTSGGGCPDIPYLNLRYVGELLSDVGRPKDVGFTLCGLMLDRAYLEACALLDGKAPT